MASYLWGIGINSHRPFEAGHDEAEDGGQLEDLAQQIEPFDMLQPKQVEADQLAVLRQHRRNLIGNIWEYSVFIIFLHIFFLSIPILALFALILINFYFCKKDTIKLFEVKKII